MPMRRAIQRLAIPLAVLAGPGCGGDDLVLPEGSPSALAVVRGNRQVGTPGTPLPDPLIVRLTDPSGVGIPDRTVVWTPESGSGTITPATGMTDAEGFASAEWTLGPAEGVQRVSAEVPDIGRVTFTATSTDGDDGEPEPEPEPEPQPATLVGVEGDGQSATAGGAVPVRPAVRVLDTAARPVEGYEVTFAVTGGGGSVTGASQLTDADGIARVGGWTLGAAPGTNTLEARAGSLAGSPVLFTAEGTEPEPEPEPDPEQVDRLVFRTPPPSAVGVNETFRVSVALVDAEGDVVPLSGVFIYLALFEDGRDSPTNDLLTGERFENTEDGIAEFDLGVDREGRYRIRALTDDLPELGPHGPEPWLFSEVFEVE
jgi:hypothetical protein